MAINLSHNVSMDEHMTSVVALGKDGGCQENKTNL